jgi:hypothetical protein
MTAEEVAELDQRLSRLEESMAQTKALARELKAHALQLRDEVRVTREEQDAKDAAAAAS